MKIKRHLILAAILGTSVAFAPAWADSTKEKIQQQAQTQAQHQSQDKAQEERSRIIEDAITALVKTNQAIRALDAGEPEKAIDFLSVAIGKLEAAVARNPELALAPIDVQVITVDAYHDVKAVKKAVREARKYLNDGKIQAARHLMETLASEIVVRVTSIPLSTYPDAIKAVIPLIDQGKIKEAKLALEEALSTLVVVDHVTPLPVVRARAMLEAASKLAQQAGRNKEDQKKLDELLKSAREQLELAKALGYGDEKDFKDFYRRIEDLQKQVAGGKTGSGDDFNELILKIDDFLENLYKKTL